MRTRTLQSMNCARNDQHHDRPVRVWTEARTDVNLPSILLSLWLLRVLHDESRHAGRKDLSDYCSHIEKQIVNLRLYRNSEVAGLVAKLVHITDTVHRDRLVSSSSNVFPSMLPDNCAAVTHLDDRLGPNRGDAAVAQDATT